MWVDSALELDGGMDPDTGMLSSHVQTALKYIDNASKDVRVSDWCSYFHMCIDIIRDMSYVTETSKSTVLFIFVSMFRLSFILASYH